MIKNKMLKIVMLITIVAILFCNNAVYGAGELNFDAEMSNGESESYQSSPLDNIFSQGESFLNEGKSNGTAIDEHQLKSVSDQIYNVLLAIGIALAVIVGAILGIQFMFGSIEQKAKIKETLIPYVLGCVVIFGAFGIWKICIQIFSKI